MNHLSMSPLLLGVVTSFLGAQEGVATPQEPGTAAAHMRGAARCKASQLIGCAITNTKNENLGEIQEIVLDGSNHRIAYAVVAFGGFLGMGEKYFAMPWRLVEIEQRGADDAPRATLGLDHATLKAAPGFDKSKWPDMANANWTKQVDEYYAARNEKARPEGATEPKGSGVGGKQGADSAPGSSGFVHRRLGQLVGVDVVDSRNIWLADVEDFIVDARHATIDGVLVSYGGTLGIGEKLVLLPANRMKLDVVRNVFVLPCSHTNLEAMALTDGKLPALNTDAWLTKGHELCAKASKEEGAVNGDVIPVDAAATRSSLHLDAYDASKVETIKGSILTVGSVLIGESREDRVRLRVLVADGRVVIVHAAPESFVAQQVLMLRRGRNVEVTGSAVTSGNQTVLVASKIVAEGKSAELRDQKGAPIWTKK